MKLIFSLTACLLFALPAWADDTHNFCLRHPNPVGPSVNAPGDDAVHVTASGEPAFAYEEWYWNAVVVGADGKSYGLQTLVFQFDFPPIVDVVQVALTDIATGEYQNDIALAYDDGYTAVPNAFDLALNDGENGAGLVAKGGGGSDNLNFTFSNGAKASVHFEGLKNASPGFDGGFANYDDPVTGEHHGAQYYMQRRNMAVYGSITLPGAKALPVLGEGWYDRQWGSVIGTPGTQANDVAWKWLSLHFDDNTDYMAWDIFATDTGNRLQHVVNEIGAAPLCEESVTHDFTMTTAGNDVSTSGPPATTFALGTTLSIPDSALLVQITPLAQNQIILSEGLFNPIWEGAVSVRGTKHGRPISGTGYMEITQSCCQSPPQ